MDQCVFRKAAVATLAYENASWREPGNFGNEDYQAHLYTIAALEVTKTEPKLPTPGTLFKRRGRSRSMSRSRRAPETKGDAEEGNREEIDREETC